MKFLNVSEFYKSDKYEVLVVFVKEGGLIFFDYSALLEYENRNDLIEKIEYGVDTISTKTTLVKPNEKKTHIDFLLNDSYVKLTKKEFLTTDFKCNIMDA